MVDITYRALERAAQALQKAARKARAHAERIRELESVVSQVDALTAERDRLREALRDLIDYANISADGGGTLGTLRSVARDARKALAPVKEGT